MIHLPDYFDDIDLMLIRDKTIDVAERIRFIRAKMQCGLRDGTIVFNQIIDTDEQA